MYQFPPPLEVEGAEIVQGGVTSAAIAEDLDVVEDCRLQRLPGHPRTAVDKLGLKCGEEAFSHCVVVGIADAAHRSQDTRPTKTRCALLAPGYSDVTGILSRHQDPLQPTKFLGQKKVTRK